MTTQNAVGELPLEGDVAPPKKAKADKTATAVAAVTPPSEDTALIQMIERVALNPNADLDKLERLIVMRERLAAQRAERDFKEALARAQAEMRPVANDADNPQTRSKYASYAALDSALRPIYTNAGFSLSFNTGTGAADNHVRVLCDVSNCGHTRVYQIDMPADGKGAKGGDVMTKTHATGSAVSYGMRYLLKMIFNIATRDASDDDGNAAGRTEERITSEQEAELRALMEKADVEDVIILEHFKVKELGELTPTQHKTAINKCKRKMEKG